MPSPFDPITFRGGATAPNRLGLAPLTNEQSHADGTLSDDERAWLVRRAAGGFGIVSTCAAHVAPDGQGFAGQLGIFDDRHVPALADLAAAIADHGALGIVQLHHAGARAPSRLTGQPPWSASAFEVPDGAERPRAATGDDLARVIGQFRDAAVRARRAGFGGVELHGAHGYLLSQFLSTAMNLRDDPWGGDPPRRARLIREVTRAVRAATPPPFVVGVRLSLEETSAWRGLDLDESIQVAAWLAEDGVDYVHLSLWDATRPTRKRPDAHPVPLVRAALPPEVAIVAAGTVWSRADAEALLARGADVVALGKAAIVEPDWPRLAAADPAFVARRPPLTAAELRARAVGPAFVAYLRRRFGELVAD